jgi:hypothetical protein
VGLIEQTVTLAELRGFVSAVAQTIGAKLELMTHVAKCSARHVLAVWRSEKYTLMMYTPTWWAV